MVTLNTTPNRGYQEPHAGNDLETDVGRLIAALRAIDVDVANALAAIVSKAGLASPAFTGTPTAPTAAPGTDSGQLATTAFVKAALVALVDSAPGALDTLNELAAAIGDDPNFAATMAALIGTKADAAATTAALALKADAATVSAERLKFLGAGVALPSSNIGPIWHADYASIMTWQVFNANGAAYTGYASSGIGMPYMDGRTSARTGYLKRNGASLSKTTYAALWAWAQHNGRVVAIGDWAAGAYVFADNGDGTFRLPDNRGEFERLWDDGRGVDSGRTFGSSQLDAVQNATGTLTNALFNNTATTDGVLAFGNSADANLTAGGGQRRQGQLSIDLSRQLRTATETRGRNVALLACIKF